MSIPHSQSIPGNHPREWIPGEAERSIVLDARQEGKDLANRLMEKLVLQDSIRTEGAGYRGSASARHMDEYKAIPLIVEHSFLYKPHGIRSNTSRPNQKGDCAATDTTRGHELWPPIFPVAHSGELVLYARTSNPVREQMTVYNWLGGPDHLANNPANWSPYGTPHLGDAASLNLEAVINIWDNALYWDNVYLTGDGDSSQSAFELNVLGPNAFNLLDGDSVSQGPTTINIENNSYWIGSFVFQPTGGSAVIQGTGGFYNGESFVGNDTIINAPVAGSGTFALLPTHAGARLEFMQSVGAGQSVAINGYAEYPGSPFGTLQVDNPSTFGGSVELGYGEALLQGILATSYSLQNDLLTLYGGTQIADQVHLTVETGPSGAQDFGVTTTSSGVVIHADGSTGAGHAWATGTALAQV